MTGGLTADERISALVRTECARVGIWDKEAVITLLDRSLLVYDDDGMPLNVLEAFDALVAAKPYLLVSGPPKPSASAAPVDRRGRGAARMQAAVSRSRRAAGGSWTSLR